MHIYIYMYILHKILLKASPTMVDTLQPNGIVRDDILSLDFFRLQKSIYCKRV